MGLLIMVNVFPKGYKSDKGVPQKAFVEGGIIVEKVIEEGLQNRFA